MADAAVLLKADALHERARGVGLVAGGAREPLAVNEGDGVAGEVELVVAPETERGGSG